MKPIIKFVGICACLSICLVISLSVLNVFYKNRMLYEKNQRLEKQIQIATDALKYFALVWPIGTTAAKQSSNALKEIKKISEAKH